MPGTCLAGLHTGREMLRYRGFLGPLRCMQLATEHRSEESHDVADESLVIWFSVGLLPAYVFLLVLPVSWGVHVEMEHIGRSR